MKTGKPLIKWGWVRALSGLIVLFFVSSLSNKMALQVTRWIGKFDRLTFVLIMFLIVLSVFILLRIFIDRQSFKNLGFSLKKKLNDIGFAGLLALILMGGMFLILTLSGLLVIKGITFQAFPLFYWLMVLLIYSALEEIPLRGYVLPNLLDSIHPYLAVIMISVLFGFLHIGNEGVTGIGIISCILLGILAGQYYVFKKNLWFPIIFHMFWNYFMGVVFGSPISGKKFHYKLLSVETKGPDWLSGGSFGFEGSVLLSLLTILAIIYTFRKYKKTKTDKK